jgi:hypothetical protein
MPIGAALGGAAIAGVGSVAAGAMSSSAQKKAANTAADTSLATARENNALLREARDQNIALATPFYNSGVAAGGVLNDLLLGTHTYNPATASATTPQTGGALSGYAPNNQWSAYLSANPDVAAEAQRVTADGEFGSPADYAQWHYQHYGQREGRALPSVQSPAVAASVDQPKTTPGSGVPIVGDTQGVQNEGTGNGALNAFDRFRAGTNYQFRFNEGMRGINSGYAARGALDSGAAEKARITFGQNIASGELSNYMNLLAQQQSVGLTAANAVMGVSTNATNAIAGQNTNASNVAANAALTSGQANANMWGSVGSAAGQVGGALFQYGMGQMQAPRVPSASSINVTPSNTQYIRAGGF